MKNYLIFAGYEQFHHNENNGGAYDLRSAEETKEKAIQVAFQLLEQQFLEQNDASVSVLVKRISQLKNLLKRKSKRHYPLI